MKNHVKFFTIILFVFSMFSQISWADRHGGWHNHDDGYPDRYRGGHGYSGFGFYFGAPFFPSPFYRYPYQTPYYPPAIITIPARPPVYIQQPPPPVIEQYSAGYWYYCYNPAGYYPYIRECPSGWQQVEPTPPEAH